MGRIIFMVVGAAVAVPVVADEHRSEGLRPAVAEHGMVAGSEPLAVEVGVEILKAGGNAVDAAIAVNAMLGLTEPMNCGMGGDLFAIVWDAKTQKLYGLNASGRSPYRTGLALYRKNFRIPPPAIGRIIVPIILRVSSSIMPAMSLCCGNIWNLANKFV